MYVGVRVCVRDQGNVVLKYRSVLERILLRDQINIVMIKDMLKQIHVVEWLTSVTLGNWCAVMLQARVGVGTGQERAGREGTGVTRTRTT